MIDRIFILGYTDYWKGRVMGFLGKMARIVAVDADANLVQALQIGALGLRNGKVLLVFPEGTRTIDGRLGEFKKGSAILACELGVPVVPVGLKGAYRDVASGRQFPAAPGRRHFRGTD